MSGQNLFASLLAGLHEDATPQEILDRVVKDAQQVIDCDGAACALWKRPGDLQLAAFTDDTRGSRRGARATRCG